MKGRPRTSPEKTQREAQTVPSRTSPAEISNSSVASSNSSLSSTSSRRTSRASATSCTLSAKSERWKALYGLIAAV